MYQLGVQHIRYVFWQDDDAWLGYLEEFPDYMTQGESLADLEEHLRDLVQGPDQRRDSVRAQSG